jgi:Spy/CpxP family protein refolding chaperone
MFQHSPSASRLLLLAVAWTLAVLPLHSQVSVPRPAPPVRGSQNSANPAPHQQPCWQQVGISKTAMDQRRSIEQNTRTQVEAVCADTSLTVQQKHEKIKEIRQQSHQEIEAVITPEQQQELKACNASRAANHPAPAPVPRPGAGTGPCGELPTNPVPAPGSSGGNGQGTPPASGSSQPSQN